MVSVSDVEDLNIARKFKMEGFDRVIFATTESSTCFGCAKDLMRSCPERETWKGIGKKGNRRAIEMGQLLAVGGKDQEKGK